MRKIFTIFSLLILISTAYGLEIEEIESYNAEEEIKGFETDQKTVFLTSNSFVQKISPDETWLKNPTGELSNRIDISEDYVLVGTRLRDSSLILYEKDGNKHNQIPVNGWVDSLGLYQLGNDDLAAGSSHGFIDLYYLNGTEKTSSKVSGYSPNTPKDSHSLFDNNSEQILVGGGGRGDGYFELIDLEDGVLWRSDGKPDGVNARLTETDEILLYTRGEITLRSPEGDVLWRQETDHSRIDPVMLEDSFIYSTEEDIVRRSYSDGEVVDRYFTGSKLKSTVKFPERDLFTGFRDGAVSIFNFEGEEIASYGLKSPVDQPKFTDFTGDGVNELAVGDGDEIRFLRLERDIPEVDQDLEKTVYVGDSREILKAAALNQTVFVSDGVNPVEEEVSDTGLKPLTPENIGDLNQAFDINRSRYYVDSRKKAVYVSKFAAEDNATLTFDRDKADRDFSEHSLEKLQDMFIERFEPNHIAVADLESEKGLLAGYMAVRQGSMPLHFSGEYSYPGEDLGPEEQNNYNGVILLEEKIQERFERIGPNEKVVFEGRYISILDGPRRMYENPVDGFFDDSDGEYYFSDLGYGDLNQNGFLDAGVGRYPEKSSEASKTFYRSKVREKSRNASVSSSYLHSSWPVILSTAGGGMRHGSQIEVLLDQKLETTHLVEYRADPVGFLLDLTPVEISAFLNEANSVEKQLARFVSDTAASSVKNALVVVEALHYTEQLLEMYYEYRWESYGFEKERSMDRLEDLEVPRDSSMDEAVQKSVVQAFYLLVWPERYPELTKENLVEEMGRNDIVYYRGVGDEDSWTLPNEGSITGGRYSGENSFYPEDIPGMYNSVIFDNSDRAGSRDASMRNSFLENGASAHIGFSTVNYAEYSSVVDYSFFSHGETLGASAVEAVNSLRSGGLVYSPETVHRSGVREKMENSLTVYGNPEMEKVSPGSNSYSFSHSCKDSLCTLRAEKDPEIQVVEENGERFLDYDADSFLLEPGLPITPLYRFEYPLPERPEEVRTFSEYRNVSGLEAPETDLLTHNEVFTNKSVEYSVFPETVSNNSYSSGDFRFVQSGIQSYEDTTSVLEKSVVEIDYRPEARIDLRNVNGSLNADLVSESFDGELLYSVGNRTGSKSIGFEGKKTVTVGELPEGSVDVEVYLVDTGIKGYTEDSFLVAEPLNIVLFSPDIHKGDLRKVRAIVENPNSFKVEKDLDLETGEKVQRGFLEPGEKTVSVEANGTKTVSWRFTGVEKGNTTVNIGNERNNVTVKSERSLTRSFTSTDSLVRLVSPERSFEHSTSSGKNFLRIESSRGSLERTRSPKDLRTTVKGPEFKAYRTVENGKKTEYVRTPRGFHRKVSVDGEIYRESENVSVYSFRANLDKLDTEVEKALEIRKGFR